MHVIDPFDPVDTVAKDGNNSVDHVPLRVDPLPRAHRARAAAAAAAAAAAVAATATATAVGSFVGRSYGFAFGGVRGTR